MYTGYFGPTGHGIGSGKTGNIYRFGQYIQVFRMWGGLGPGSTGNLVPLKPVIGKTARGPLHLPGGHRWRGGVAGSAKLVRRPAPGACGGEIVKDDERQLLERCLAGEATYDRWPRSNQGDMPWKRLRYLCERKWYTKGFYEYGVTCDLGWFDEAKARAYLDA